MKSLKSSKTFLFCQISKPLFHAICGMNEANISGRDQAFACLPVLLECELILQYLGKAYELFGVHLFTSPEHLEIKQGKSCK